MRKNDFHSRSIQEFIVSQISRELGMREFEIARHDDEPAATYDPLREMSYEAYKNGQLATCDTIVTVRA